MISDKGGKGVEPFSECFLTRGEGGVGQFLTLADKGGRGVWTPPFLADVICEQPLTTVSFVSALIFVLPRKPENASKHV